MLRDQQATCRWATTSHAFHVVGTLWSSNITMENHNLLYVNHLQTGHVHPFSKLCQIARGYATKFPSSPIVVQVGCSIKWGYPKKDALEWNIHSKLDDLEVSSPQETSICQMSFNLTELEPSNVGHSLINWKHRKVGLRSVLPTPPRQT